MDKDIEYLENYIRGRFREVYDNSKPFLNKLLDWQVEDNKEVDFKDIFDTYYELGKCQGVLDELNIIQEIINKHKN